MPIHVCSCNCQFLPQTEPTVFLCEESQYIHVCGLLCDRREWNSERHCWHCGVRGEDIPVAMQTPMRDSARVTVGRNQMLQFSSTAKVVIQRLITQPRIRADLLDEVVTAYSHIIREHRAMSTYKNIYFAIAIVYTMADGRQNGLVPSQPALKDVLPNLSTVDRLLRNDGKFKLKHVTQVMRQLQAISTSTRSPNPHPHPTSPPAPSAAQACSSSPT